MFILLHRKKMLAGIIIPAIMVSALLYCFVNTWVVGPNLPVAPDYYEANYDGKLMPRIVVGTVSHWLGLSKGQFARMLAGFECLWMFLLCTQVFRWIEDRAWAAMLCLLLICNGPVYVNNSQFFGYVDIVMFFWVMLAASLVVKYPEAPPRQLLLRFAGAWLALLIAILIHEFSIFLGAMICLWVLCFYGFRGLAFAVSWAALVLGYVWICWERKSAVGEPTVHYVWYIEFFNVHEFFGRFFSLLGIVCAV